MIIAKLGNFALRTATYLGEHTYTTHDISVDKYNKDGTCYTIADFDDEGQVMSCGNRLFEAIEDYEDFESAKRLIEIGSSICSLPEVPSQYTPDFILS